MTGQNPTRGRRRGGTMLHIEGLDETATARLMAPLDLSGAGGAHDEAWLQRLIHQFPQVLPVNDLEPGFSRLVSICRELPVRTGYIDSLFATGDGDLVLVECKLWRNPQARREVVAQIIDYAHCLAGWSYEDLDQAVRQARTAGEGDEAALYVLVDGDDALEEAAFVDAVSRTLRLGRFLLIVLGDGIHESAETLAGYLQELLSSISRSASSKLRCTPCIREATSFSRGYWRGPSTSRYRPGRGRETGGGPVAGSDERRQWMRHLDL